MEAFFIFKQALSYESFRVNVELPEKYSVRKAGVNLSDILSLVIRKRLADILDVIR